MPDNREKPDIRSYTFKRLKTYVTETLNAPAYRAGQLFSWFHEKCVSSYDEMTNIPKNLREYLAENTDFHALKPKEIKISKLDGTRKYLFELEDGHFIESVLMRYIHGNSVCVSSQVGCAMGCAFCASTLNGLIRNLTASEILSQIYEIQKNTGERISNIVVMGMGEPLANYDNVMDFARIITDENTLHISHRNITISTCGLVPAIKKMADESLKVTLALSLHASNDGVRRAIMPSAARWSIEETLEACDYYFKKTGRRVTFEYCLIDGVNCGREHAEELARLLKGRGAHVNLIRFNETPENNFREPPRKAADEFQRILEREGINFTIRREMGRDIKGACGQLAGEGNLREPAGNRQKKAVPNNSEV